MRLAATLLLAAMALLFGLAASFKRHYPALAWLEAFAEAGLVGGLADWFAVVALFRHPLGLKLPHTAIVPSNKDRIGRALGGFVERNFLTPANIVARLQGIDLAGRAARWLGRPANAASVAAAARDALPRLIEALDDAEIEGMIGRLLASRLDRLDTANLTAGLLSVVVDSGRHQAVLDQVLEQLALWLDANRPTLESRVAAQSRYTPKFLDAYVVNRFINGVIDLVGEVVVAPRHELRAAFDQAVRDFIARLRTDPGLIAKAAQLKQELVKSLAVEEAVSSIWAEVKRRMLDGGTDLGRFEARLAATIIRLAEDVRRDRVLTGRLNQGAIRLIEALLGRFRRQVAPLIAEVIERWDARRVAASIELEVGGDLQFIRVNGTLVGGGAGLLLHLLLVLAGLG